MSFSLLLHNYYEKCDMIQLMIGNEKECSLGEVNEEKKQLIELFFQIIDHKHKHQVSFIHRNANMISDYIDFIL